MKLFTDLKLKFEKEDWKRNTEFALIDSILEMHPEIFNILKADICEQEKESVFGMKDTPSVEQIIRAAIFKEMRGLDYRELEYAQTDSRICSAFIKLDDRKSFCFQMFQKYISKIKIVNLQKVLVLINKFSIEAGFEDVKIRSQDTTVVETNIHYPTNNALTWDCIKESYGLLEYLKEEMDSLEYIDYTKTAKKTHFKINVRKKDKRVDLFYKQWITFTKAINEVSNAIKIKSRELGSRGDTVES